MKFLLIPVILASFIFFGFFGLFEKPDLIKPESIVLADSLKNTVICYENHVKPVLEGNCSPCHIKNKAGWVSLNTSKDCAKRIDNVIRMLIKGKMPPGDRAKLSGNDVAVLKAWKENGFKDCPPVK